MNRLQKIDLLDEQGRPWELAALPDVDSTGQELAKTPFSRASRR